MSVAVSSHRDRAVAHPARERVDVHAGRNTERGLGVAHIVEANIRQFGPFQQPIELQPQVARVEWRTILATKDQPGRVPALAGDRLLLGLILLMPFQHAHHIAREWNRTVRLLGFATGRLPLSELAGSAVRAALSQCLSSAARSARSA